MATTCFHVTTSTGDVYGVAATGKREAMQMTQDRLTGEQSTNTPVKAERIGSWTAAYGTVLAY